MLRVNSHVVDGIHPQSYKFVAGVKTKVMGDSKLNDILSIMSSKLTFACVSWVTSLSSHHALSLSSELTASPYYQTKTVDNRLTYFSFHYYSNVKAEARYNIKFSSKGNVNRVF